MTGNALVIDSAIQTIRELQSNKAEELQKHYEWGYCEGYEKAKEEIRLALSDVRVEAKQLMNNITILIDTLDKAETEDDFTKFDELADQLMSGFKHIEIF